MKHESISFVSTKRTVSAAIAGATEVPVRGANSNTHRPPQKKAGGLGDPTPETRQAGPSHHFGAGHKQAEARSWTLVPAPPPSRQFPNKHPCTQGAAGASAAARTYPWWEPQGHFSPPRPRRAWVTIGRLPACIPGMPEGHQRQQVPSGRNSGGYTKP